MPLENVSMKNPHCYPISCSLDLGSLPHVFFVCVCELCWGQRSYKSMQERAYVKTNFLHVTPMISKVMEHVGEYCSSKFNNGCKITYRLCVSLWNITEAGRGQGHCMLC